MSSKPEKISILYDPQMFGLQKYGGISRYFANLISGIKKSKDFTATLPILYSTNYYVRNFPQILNNRIGRSWLKRERRRNKWNQYLSKRYIKQGNFDIFHPTYYDPYFLKVLKKPLVVTVHDMIYENYAHLYKDADSVINMKRAVIESADLIIAISQYTKQEIIRYYPHLTDKIKVVYHGLPEESVPVAQEVLPKRFLLYIGDRDAVYKNFVPLIESIAPQLNDKLHIVCAGGNPFTQKELDIFKKLKISEYITQKNASDSLILQLYQQALIFIYPSLEEGFGLPMLEAFKNGCPIACSNTSCLPEVGGTAVSYFDPWDAESMNDTISKLIIDDQLRHKHIEDGLERVRAFTFEKCLHQTLDCYRSLMIKA